ncbi:hypothetical protein [Kribbella sp. CA-293567]|uniref:hypothetical protein n=1 Tax=Kribbella sp. CA-293567 TaxID=3002436 RepID=UPI0022DCFE65|nr:hypothetical protein [Kribbella sp. CA-293567]WBQ07609.1 hypothetical protein OX958_12580 [Kribbella sp. CA-293567]
MINRKKRKFFVIFAHARSGSDNLCNALGEHPGLRVVNEPFNPNYPSWADDHVDYGSQVSDAPSLAAQLEILRHSFDGMKTLEWNLPPELNDGLLADEDHPLLFLRRRNLLEAVVSHWIACQTNLWQVWHAKKPLADHYDHLEPAPVENLRQTLDQLSESMRHYAAVVAERDPATYLSCTYEDLYHSTEQRRRELFEQIVRLFGVSPIPYQQVAEMLGPRGKLNSRSTYAKIPNLLELDRALGSTEHGRLLTEPAG